MIDFKALKSGTDVRGRALGDNAPLTAEAAGIIGAAFVCWLQKQGIAAPRVNIGRDSRLSGEMLLDACADGMARQGAQVVCFGMCTTPAMYMSLLTEGVGGDASIMVTASHHPSDRNGLKFFIRRSGITGEELNEILAIAADLEVPDSYSGTIGHFDYLPVYQKLLADRVRTGLDTDIAKPLLGIHIVVDAGNGGGGFYADMLQSLGAWTEGSQFLEPDGHFPNHIPNPENAQAMEMVSDAVKKAGADLGVIFDADCDRAAIVDQNGREINRNRLIALISAILLDKTPGITVVTDSVTSSGLSRFIGDWGGVHYRYKRGYRNVIDEAIKLNEAGIDCPLAIETSGHAALRENHFLDDGMYLVTVLICEAMRLKQQGKSLSDLLDGLKEPVESAEIRLNITAEDFRETGREAIAQVMDYAAGAQEWHIAPDNREGVRINFDLPGGLENGWFLLRLSVHDPVLPLNIESDVEGGAKKIAESLYKVLKDADQIDLKPLQDFIGA